MPSPTPAPAASSHHGAANDVSAGPTPVQWAAIVQQLGAEIAAPLSAALERIEHLAETGQIDRQGLRALRDAVAQAREAGIVGQQLARLAQGQPRLAREHLQLAQLLRSVLTQRSHETQARGIQIRQLLKPFAVLADGALLYSLFNALLDWALASTHTAIELRLDQTPWPPKARLTCRFAHRALDLGPASRQPAHEQPDLDSLAWRLVEQTALSLGVLPLREDLAGYSTLTLEFPPEMNPTDELSGGGSEPAAPEAPPTVSVVASPAPAGLAPQQRSLAGCQLLIITPRADLRRQLQEVLRHLQLMVDMVDSAEEAARFCAEGPPHALLFDGAERGPELEILLAELKRDAPGCCAIEVLNDERPTQLSTATPDGLARIARRHLGDALPSVLRFELSRAG